MPDLVLVTWLATRGDPFERTGSGGDFVQRNGARIPGPTLALLTDPASPYASKITDAVILRQGGNDAATHDRIYSELVDALEERAPTLRLHPETWVHDDPTDHEAIYEFLRELLPRIRRKFRGRELVVHLSPGTAAMHTVWVLMAETGFIEPPFVAVQSLRPEQRRGRPAVVPLSLGLDTFFKRWQRASPAAVGDEDAGVTWDPRRFRTDRLRSLYDEARRVARLKVPVLILGERGTGKTTLASWIRFRSPFRQASLDQAWPAVPCGQYTPETMRAELFGYVKGAFTGAIRDHAGLLERANNDTLFLDEIGDISKDLQRLLIKVLEEGTFQPLGSTATKKTDLRLLAATNLPPDRLSERLDADFLDRVSAFTLVVPALREVPEELEWLWPTVLDAAASRARAPKQYAKLATAQNARFVGALRASALPGNVRDLFRVAWRFLAARADDDAPMTVHDAIDYAISGLVDGGNAAHRPGAVGTQGLWRAFADNLQLDERALQDGPLDPEEAILDFKNWIAVESYALAKRTGRRVRDLVQVEERTLRNWRRKNDS